jgi:CRISPR-associated endoribonuclease Cas6
MMYFVALTIFLRPRDRRSLTIADSIYAHAAIFSTISKADATLGRAMHDMQRNKRIALAIVDHRNQTPLLRIAFMALDGLVCAHLLIDGLTRDSTLQLGPTTCDVSAVTVESGSWSGVSTWADITAESIGRHLRFHFVTPTAITKRGDCGERFFSLFPDPFDVFAGLARRWMALDGPSLPADLADFLKSGGCVTANHDVQTTEFRTRERTQIGFVGRVVYECRKPSSPHLDALRALTRLAFFTGVGYQTARGMGLTQTSITE